MARSLAGALERFKASGYRIAEVIYPDGEDYRGRESFEQSARDLRDQLARAGFEIAEEALTHFLHNNALLLALDKNDSLLGVLSYDEEGDERWITQMETMIERGGTGTALVCAATVNWGGKLIVAAYEEAVPFYLEHLGMTLAMTEDVFNLARLTWEPSESANAAQAFDAEGLAVSNLGVLDGLKLQHTVQKRSIEII